jgi:pimeloyl-ACP methyl ester carboxylesterase
MSTYVLIHGAWLGAWSWDKVVPLLEKEGHIVEAPDLPGHGRDKTPIQEVSLQAYADRVCRVLDDQPEPVILVGHSMGGAVITQAAEHRPGKVETLVYLAAFLPRDGESISQFSNGDTEALIGPNLIMAEDGSSTLREEGVKEMAFADCSDEDVAWAKSLLVRQALAPIASPVSTTEKSFGRIPRVYIECLRDRTVSPSVQKKMYTALPCRTVISMNTSHCPMLSAPEELVAHLTSLDLSGQG